MDVDFHSYSAVVSERQQRRADINKSHARESHISVITCDGREYLDRSQEEEGREMWMSSL